jgi:hypothetical protein
LRTERLPPTVVFDFSELCLDILRRGWTVGGRKLWCFSSGGNAKMAEFFKKMILGQFLLYPSKMNGSKNIFSATFQYDG